MSRIFWSLAAAGAFSLTLLLVSGASANPVKPGCVYKVCTRYTSVNGQRHCVSWVQREALRCH